MTNEEAIKQLKWVQKRISEITYSPESFEALNLAIETLRNETQKDDDLCETCRYGDICVQSDKGVSFAKHSKCWKYGKEGGIQ